MSKGGPLLVTVAVIGVLNSAVSLFYYARVLKAMYFDAVDENAPAIPIPALHAGVIGAMAIPTVALFVAWSPLMKFVESSLTQWAPAIDAVKTALVP
jgi:NADH-quinone oxidoreductase subunit N